jgi:hypothetical protein
MIRDNLSVRDKSSAVAGPANLYRQRIEIRFGGELLRDSRADNLLTRFKETAYHRTVPEEFPESRREDFFREAYQIIADLFGVTAEGEFDPFRAGVMVYNQRKTGIFRTLNQERGFPFPLCTDGNFRQFEGRIDFNACPV